MRAGDSIFFLEAKVLTGFTPSELEGSEWNPSPSREFDFRDVALLNFQLSDALPTLFFFPFRGIISYFFSVSLGFFKVSILHPAIKYI